MVALNDEGRPYAYLPHHLNLPFAFSFRFIGFLSDSCKRYGLLKLADFLTKLEMKLFEFFLDVYVHKVTWVEWPNR